MMIDHAHHIVRYPLMCKYSVSAVFELEVVS